MEVLELTKSLISCPSVTPKNEGVLGIKRISHCHPFKVLGSREGFDPVPPKE